MWSSRQSNGQTNGSSYKLPLLINGQDVESKTTFPVTSPATGDKLWEASSVSREDAIKAVDAAVAAFPAWSATKPAARRAIFLKAADILDERKQECIDYMKEETGALEPFCVFNLVNSIEILRGLAGRISGALTGSMPVCDDDGKYALVFKEPYGVVLGIAPW